MDYRALIAPFIDFRRAKVKTDKTIRDDTRTLYESIDFFEQGNFSAPNEEYFSALEAHLLQRFKQSTTDSKISLTRKFFTWTQKGDAHMQEDIQITNPEQSDGLTESIEASNEEAPKTDFTEEHEEILEGKAEASNEPENKPSIPHVDTDTKKPMPPHEQQEGAGLKTHSMGRPRKSSEARTKKLSIYLTPSLEADLKALARIQELSTPDYIFHLIERETERKADKIAAFRALKED